MSEICEKKERKPWGKRAGRRRQGRGNTEIPHSPAPLMSSAPFPNLLDLMRGYIRLALEVPMRLLPDWLNTAALPSRHTQPLHSTERPLLAGLYQRWTYCSCPGLDAEWARALACLCACVCVCARRAGAWINVGRQFGQTDSTDLIYFFW